MIAGEIATVIAIGARVEILAGRLRGRRGIVSATWVDAGCGCRSIIVRVDGGLEWVGRPSEVRPA